MQIHLGVKVRDRVTGFQGTTTGRCEYLTGCTQLLVVPSVDEKGAARDAQWYDEQRLEVLDETPIVLDNSETPGCDIPAPIR